MTQAILDGRKTQTRRVVKLAHFGPSETPGYDWTWRGHAPIRSYARQLRYPDGCWQDVSHEKLLSICPYGQPGDLLWTKRQRFQRKADAAAWLEVVAVRVERLRDIQWYDIRAEGVDCPEHDGPGVFCTGECPLLRHAFSVLWDDINEKRGYPLDSNPWCWVISFRRID